jgi:hypothetical protein
LSSASRRETYHSISYKKTDEIMDHAREFVMKIKLLSEEIDDEIVFSVIKEEIKKLQGK